MKKLTHYQTPNKDWWTGHIGTTEKTRLFQTIKCIDINQLMPAKMAILGFAGDLGVQRNQGNPGANEGPSALRQAAANLPIEKHRADNTFIDVGDIVCQNDLAAAQKELADCVTQLIHNNTHPLLFGGGHEMAWGHYQGIAAAKPNAKIGIINFSAHCDLQPITDDDIGTSDSPFLQIAQHCQESNRDFHYLCLGTQPSSNPPFQFETAEQCNVSTITAEEIQTQSLESLLTKIENFIQPLDSIYLTLRMDVFAAAIAPGVSAPQSRGLYPWQMSLLLAAIACSKKVISFDIAELSPPNDLHGMTAQLAAGMLSIYLQARAN